MPQAQRDAMEIRLNGEKRVIPLHSSVQHMLTQQGIREQRIAVAVNRKVIPRSLHESAIIEPGDHIEILEAVGGG